MSEMNITSAQYQADFLDSSVNDSIIATIDGVVMSVPLDPTNRHYKAILEWEAIPGNDILDAG